MPPDTWLEPWLPQIRQHAGLDPILELGCGTGVDTAVLLGADLQVVAIDISVDAVTQARQYAPGATYLAQDLRSPWPIGAGSAGAVLASLSLHYFSWAETLTLFDRIKQTLVVGGMLLCRLNSTEDENFGAVGYPELEPSLFLVAGQTKRFFDQDSISAALGNGWEVISLTKYVTGKYAKPKVLWELACTKSAV